jgi:hypothetical protein
LFDEFINSYAFFHFCYLFLFCKVRFCVARLLPTPFLGSGSFNSLARGAETANGVGFLKMSSKTYLSLPYEYYYTR